MTAAFNTVAPFLHNPIGFAGIGTVLATPFMGFNKEGLKKAFAAAAVATLAVSFFFPAVFTAAKGVVAAAGTKVAGAGKAAASYITGGAPSAPFTPTGKFAELWRVIAGGESGGDLNAMFGVANPLINGEPLSNLSVAQGMAFQNAAIAPDMGGLPTSTAIGPLQYTRRTLGDIMPITPGISGDSVLNSPTWEAIGDTHLDKLGVAKVGKTMTAEAFTEQKLGPTWCAILKPEPNPLADSFCDNQKGSIPFLNVVSALKHALGIPTFAPGH